MTRDRETGAIVVFGGGPPRYPFPLASLGVRASVRGRLPGLRQLALAAFTALSLVTAGLACGTGRPAPPPAATPAGAPDGAPVARPAVPAGTVVVDSFWSQALGTRKHYVVYLPPSYDRDAGRRYPVAYYLHGMWGRETDWTKQGRLAAVMDSLVAAGGRELIVVMPDGDDSWYTTWNRLLTYQACARTPPTTGEPVETYCVPWGHYDDYVAHDLVGHVDSTLRTLPGRATRGIAGLSMGGYGAITLALRYPDVFSAAASHSGVLSPLYTGPHPFAGRATYASDESDLRAAWGPRFWPYLEPSFGRDTAAWWSRDPARLAKRLKEQGGPMPALFVDVGTGDSLTIDQNRAFDAELRALGVAHVYHEWPGAHSWQYWRAHVGESLAWLAERIAGG